MHEALFALADAFNAVGGDMHTMHLNYRGAEFDTMHKKVLRKYYEQCANDYDEAAEWGCSYDQFAPNKNESAVRIQYRSLEAVPINRALAVNLVAERLARLVEMMTTVFRAVNNSEEALAIGVANWLQTRLEYWSKELYYFNKRREEWT